MSTEADSFSFQPRAHISISRVDHSTSIMKSVDDIFQKQLFTDVCLSCENQIINAHRLILAASTSFFHSLFSQQPCCLNPNPVIVMKDIKIAELKAILEFIYFGSCTVPEDQLNSLIKSAESLGVYGLGKLNPDSVNESKNDDQQCEINNNVAESSPKNGPTVSKEPAHKNDSSAGKSPNATNLNKSQPEKIKRKVVLTNHTHRPTEADDLEEKRKKRELINLTIDQNNASTSQQSSTSTSPSRAEQQSASKRQSLRIRTRKVNPDPTKDGAAYDLNTSHNSDLSLSEISATNGKRPKRADYEEASQNDELRDELMSVDGSEYCAKGSAGQQLPPDHREENATANGGNLSANKISIRERTLKLKRNKNSILRKHSNDQQPRSYKLMMNKSDGDAPFGLVATRRSQLEEELGLQSANQVLTDDDDDEAADLSYEENIVMKKLDSPAGGSSLNASRKNSVDSNNGELNLIKLRDRGDHNNESSTSAGNQSLLAKQQASQQKKKRRRTSIDNDS